MPKNEYLLLLFSPLILTTSCETSPAPPSPNIVWLVSEDNSPFIGVYGDSLAKTPNIDKLAENGVVYRHAFSNAPVCAPARNTIITGMYANSLGNQQMRSYYKAPAFVKYFPEYLREAGYYTSNCSKEDYNTELKGDPWNESSRNATYKNRKPGQPFFHVQNYSVTHESSLFDSIPDEELPYDPDEMKVFPYHPDTPDFRHDYAQYYHRIAQLDEQIGSFIDDLESQGLYDSTIIFYYGDHGGVLPRGKRYLFESGTRVPMIVHIPEIYRHLMPDEIGDYSDRIVSFVDLAPTILNALGLEIPEYMQGQPFLGEEVPESPKFAFMFRGRMDEAYDLMHAARDQNFRYIRNYYPERVYGQHLNFLWRSRALRNWEKLYKEGKLNDVQSAYWQTKPYEELYDIHKDPHNITNLAEDPEYAERLLKMREATNSWLENSKAVDVLPEPLMQQINKDTVIYDYIRMNDFPLLKIQEAARLSARAGKKDFTRLYKMTQDKNPVIAFWAIKSMAQYGEELKSSGKLEEFKEQLSHPESYIRMITANVLLDIGEKPGLKELIRNTLDSDNEFDRLEALHLYRRLERDKITDTKILNIYKDKEVAGWKYDRRVYDKIFAQ